MALQKIIEDHLSVKSLSDIEGSCVFTSLSSDMQRSKAVHRGMYESHMNRIYALFTQALHEQFPEDTDERSRARAMNLYSGLVGTLTMARTMKDPVHACEILESGKQFLITNFVRQPTRSND
jgi:hypothetical protein